MTLRTLALALVALLLVACGSATATPTPPPTAAVATDPAAYPGPVTPTIPAMGAIPTAPADAGVVHGSLLVGRTNPTPVQAAILYLAHLVPEAQGTPFLAAFDRQTSPKSFTDGEGRFFFAAVPPGVYGLVLDRISDSYLLGDPNEVLPDFVFEAKPGEVLDLGQLVYTSLPGYEPIP